MLRISVARLVSGLHHRAWLTRAMTLGVRVIVLDERGVFLVRHTYAPGWYLPGGGVDRGESAEAAAMRELWEEGGIRSIGRPVLHGLYRNGRRDHVACYVVREVDAPEVHEASYEIAEVGWFAPDALPPGTTPATRARLDEVHGRRAPSEDW